NHRLHVDGGVVVAGELAARLPAGQVEFKDAVLIGAQVDLAVPVEVAHDRIAAHVAGELAARGDVGRVDRVVVEHVEIPGGAVEQADLHAQGGVAGEIAGHRGAVD